MMMLVIFFIFSIMSSISSAKLPPDFKKCSMEDLSCLKEAIQDALPKLKEGLPELGIPPLDPLNIPYMQIRDFENTVKLVQNYRDAKFTGLSDATINELIFDISEGKISLDFSTPMLQLNATYNVNGTFLNIPVIGRGQCLLSLGDVASKITFQVETYSENNEQYLRGTHADLTIDAKHPSLRFDVIGLDDSTVENFNNILNEHAKSIYNETINEYLKVYADYIMKLMNSIFEKIPISELFLNE